MNDRTQSTARLRPLALLAAAVAVLVTAPAALLAAANATAPHGSRAEVILENRDATGQPYNASLNGWWGHEGGKNDTGKRPTIVSMDASDGHGVVDAATTAALHDAIGDGGRFDTLRVAFVPFSADGSNERPRVHKGENAGEAFKWFSDLGFGTALNGTTNKNDLVRWVSTLGEYTEWWNRGRTVQTVDDKLRVLDIQPNKTAKLSSTPQGSSILNRWPAGTKISLVFYVADGVDRTIPQIPTVKVGPDGRALTSWLTLETVASPTNPARTSGGYRVLTGAGTGPAAAAKPKPAGSKSQQQTTGQISKGGQSTSGSRPADSGSSAHAKHSGFMSALPGGQPTFWILTFLVLACVAGGAVMRLRASPTPPSAGAGTSSTSPESYDNAHH